jgi:hypothetical protein
VDLDRLERDARRRWTEITGAPFAATLSRP